MADALCLFSFDVLDIYLLSFSPYTFPSIFAFKVTGLVAWIYNLQASLLASFLLYSVTHANMEITKKLDIQLLADPPVVVVAAANPRSTN